jgi:transglutaminase-like putative cysteine protease
MMFAKTVAVLLLLSSLATACVADTPTAPQNNAPPTGGPPRHLVTQFSYTATAIPTSGTKVLEVWLPIPSDYAWQTVSDIQVASPAGCKITREPRFGNRMVSVREARPSGPLVVTVAFTVDRREVRVLDSPSATDGTAGMPSAGMALQPDKRVPIGGRFKTIADASVQNQATPLDRERALFDSVVATTRYDYKKQSPEYAQGDSVFVCDYKSGNCSDLHSYLISLSRSVGIPAILEFGFPLTGIPFPQPIPTAGTISGYHCWTWFHDPTLGWVPLDAADGRRWLDAGYPGIEKYLFGDLLLERSAVAMSRGRDIILSPPQKGAPLNYFIYPYAEADGQTVSATWKLTYRILSQTQ